MMGDNRDNSEDSRAPTGHRSMAAQFPEAWPNRGTNLGGDPKDDAIGFVPLDHLIGRAETVLFTLHNCKKAPGTECPQPRLWKGLQKD
jgi:signal peptidase I